MKKILFSVSFLFLLIFQSQGQIAHNMTLLGHVNNPNLPLVSGLRYNDCWGWTDSTGREFAILGSMGFTYFINISNPSMPVVCDSAAGTFNGCIHRDFKTYGKYCYGVADEGTSSLQIFDMSFLPDSVHKVYDSNNFFTRCHNIWIDTIAGRLYAVGTNTQNSGVIVLNVAANPANPPLISSLNLGHYTHDIYVRNDTAWCSNGNAGYFAYNYSNALSPVPIMQLSTYPYQGYNHSSWLTDDSRYAIMADETWGKKLKVVDVSNLSNPTVVSTFRSMLIPTDTGSIPHNPFMAGYYCVISYYHDGVQIFDLSNPLNPFQTAWYDTQPLNTNYAGYDGAWGTYPYFPSSTVIGSDVLTGLYILRVGFPFPRPLSLDLVGANIPCNGGNNGRITVTCSGGTAPYSFSWSSGQSSQNLSNLSPGWYVVTMSDRYGYSTTDSVLITQPPALSVSGTTTMESCPGALDGCIDITILGGTGPINTHTWNSSPVQNTEDPCNLATGDYTVTIMDANGCTLVDTFSVGLQNNAPFANFSSTQVLTTATFTDNSTGGSSYHWTFGDGDTSNLASPVHLYATSGSFTVCLYVTNVCGTDTFCDTLTVSEVGVNAQIIENNISLSPIPAKDNLLIGLIPGAKGKISQVILQDISGKTVYSNSYSPQQSFTVPVQGFASGLYFARIKVDGNVVVLKWVKE